MKIPNYLKHKPIYKIEGYDIVDKAYDHVTDVVGLSLGKAQWSSDFVPSVKVWRHNKRWSRQSEETTLTRALDMATLIIKVLNKHYNGVPVNSIDTIYGSLEITESPKAINLVNELDEYLSQEKNRKYLNAHIETLFNALKEYTVNAK